MPVLCSCGCGLPTPLAQRTNASRGVTKGQPCRFVAGHKGRSLSATDYRKRQTERGPVREHVVVAERAIGKRLPRGAEVHHVDENRRNNRNANLVICQDHAYHHFLHVRARIVRAGGNPNTDKVCSLCQRPLPYGAFHRQAGGTLGLSMRCRQCALAYQRERYSRKRAVA